MSFIKRSNYIFVLIFCLYVIKNNNICYGQDRIPIEPDEYTCTVDLYMEALPKLYDLFKSDPTMNQHETELILSFIKNIPSYALVMPSDWFAYISDLSVSTNNESNLMESSSSVSVLNGLSSRSKCSCGIGVNKVFCITADYSCTEEKKSAALARGDLKTQYLWTLADESCMDMPLETNEVSCYSVHPQARYIGDIDVGGVKCSKWVWEQKDGWATVWHVGISDSLPREILATYNSHTAFFWTWWDCNFSHIPDSKFEVPSFCEF